LTSGPGSHKTESVSALHKITGGALRLQVNFAFFDMLTKPSQLAQRKPRADAARNRERILEVAKEAFTRSGANASLDDIAKESRVGPGTLYRHFPTREELLQAVYRSELEKLAAAERKVAQTMTRSKRCEPGCCSSLMPSRQNSSSPLRSIRWWAITRKCSQLLTLRCRKRFAPW